MELALEFWSLPFRFLMNASANLLVFVADSHGASLGPPGRQMRDTGAHLGGRLAAPGRLQGEDWVDTRPQGRLQGGDWVVKRPEIRLKGEDWVVKRPEIRLQAGD